MDPQVKSILSSVALALATSIAGYAASRGLIPTSDQSALANQLVTLGFGVTAAAIAWYKARQHTPAAQIAAVNNADNGVKVVADTASAPAVTIPMKGK